ncbi:MAG: CsbD family protein [Comamonadaceae bacterium]|nr:MAG: CsbD family protein [Comamonadaceae bacterium]
MVDLNRVEGTVKNLAGKAEQAYGEATGDTSTEARGHARQAEGGLQNLYGEAIDQIKGAGCEVTKAVERNPLGALLVAGAIGYIFAAITRR